MLRHALLSQRPLSSDLSSSCFIKPYP
ncbi:hypothetical protein MED222_06465 [Vibrio sp. MED222]|nr:hypothetical protein MED222_06465 [Vibrio sp. MED222]